MRSEPISSKISAQILDLIDLLEGEVSFDNKKVKNIKSIIESLQKVTNTLLQLKKLEQAEEIFDQNIFENDAKILKEFLQKYSENNKNV